jgi:NADH-quinone oxidoreductase subunit J
MSWPLVLFCVLTTITGFSALMVVFSRNIVRAAVGLLFTLIGVSLMYFLLGAEFVGATQLIIYVGGTLVLVVFGVMLTAQQSVLQIRTKLAEWVIAGLIGLSLFSILVYASFAVSNRSENAGAPSTAQIGMAFLNVTDASPTTPETKSRLGYLLPFEIVSIHLLVVLIGAAYLARAKRRMVHEQSSPMRNDEEKRN